jgi:hypothetical protein
MADERRYLAYMVRLWSVHHNGDLVWRASAENAHTGERHAFAHTRGCGISEKNHPVVNNKEAQPCCAQSVYSL